ncbi:unnamed protein product [Owenia fusiformis]|uniref:IRF tryptophan pentad repeat domain-containing protein n=1 Tax=Owenia fusiformis TaxID=6347 RepID=A0A8S4Q124_OWEFU|nr:unnamed protein product [Owenia fusiformis]
MPHFESISTNVQFDRCLSFMSLWPFVQCIQLWKLDGYCPIRFHSESRSRRHFFGQSTFDFTLKQQLSIMRKSIISTRAEKRKLEEDEKADVGTELKSEPAVEDVKAPTDDADKHEEEACMVIDTEQNEHEAQDSDVIIKKEFGEDETLELLEQHRNEDGEEVYDEGGDAGAQETSELHGQTERDLMHMFKSHIQEIILTLHESTDGFKSKPKVKARKRKKIDFEDIQKNFLPPLLEKKNEILSKLGELFTDICEPHGNMLNMVKRKVIPNDEGKSQSSKGRNRKSTVRYPEQNAILLYVQVSSPDALDDLNENLWVIGDFLTESLLKDMQTKSTNPLFVRASINQSDFDRGMRFFSEGSSNDGFVEGQEEVDIEGDAGPSEHDDIEGAVIQCMQEMHDASNKSKFVHVRGYKKPILTKGARLKTKMMPLSPMEREKMRYWLTKQVDSGEVPGLQWQDEAKTLIRIPWVHAARHCWNYNDADVFKRWALHTRKYLEGEEPNPKQWKANFRCALNSLPDIQLVSTMGVKQGGEAYRVYRLLADDEAAKVRAERLAQQEAAKGVKPVRPQVQDNDGLLSWLIKQTDKGEIPELAWFDKRKTMIKIPWVHSGINCWRAEKENSVFKAWAVHTGRYKEGGPTVNAKQWKVNFRCALNSLQTISEVKQLSFTVGHKAYRVYKIRNEKRKLDGKSISKLIKKASEKHKAEQLAELEYARLQRQGNNNFRILKKSVDSESATHTVSVSEEATDESQMTPNVLTIRSGQLVTIQRAASTGSVMTGKLPTSEAECLRVSPGETPHDTTPQPQTIAKQQVILQGEVQMGKSAHILLNKQLPQKANQVFIGGNVLQGGNVVQSGNVTHVPGNQVITSKGSLMQQSSAISVQTGSSVLSSALNSAQVVTSPGLGQSRTTMVAIPTSQLQQQLQQVQKVQLSQQLQHVQKVQQVQKIQQIPQGMVVRPQTITLTPSSVVPMSNHPKLTLAPSSSTKTVTLTPTNVVSAPKQIQPTIGTTIQLNQTVAGAAVNTTDGTQIYAPNLRKLMAKPIQVQGGGTPGATILRLTPNPNTQAPTLGQPITLTPALAQQLVSFLPQGPGGQTLAALNPNMANLPVKFVIRPVEKTSAPPTHKASVTTQPKVVVENLESVKSNNLVNANTEEIFPSLVEEVVTSPSTEHNPGERFDPAT